MFKKKIALLTLSAVMTGMLAGCGGGAEKAAGSETAEAAAAKPDKKIVIKYWYAFGDKIEEPSSIWSKRSMSPRTRSRCRRASGELR